MEGVVKHILLLYVHYEVYFLHVDSSAESQEEQDDFPSKNSYLRQLEQKLKF